MKRFFFTNQPVENAIDSSTDSVPAVLVSSDPVSGLGRDSSLENRIGETCQEDTRQLYWKRPLLFYILTWISTTVVGMEMYGLGKLSDGFFFSIPLMLILTFHELGHFFQTRRYGVYSTFPFFIPMPLPPFGTLGAVIRMDNRIPNIRALFDIGISGPLAGLVPTIIFLFLGMSQSQLVPLPSDASSWVFGEPLILDWVSRLFFDRSDPELTLMLHPIGMAAWSGLFLTTLNLFPLGQLDGGHVFYTLLKQRAIYAGLGIFLGIIVYILVCRQWQWSLMVLLLMVIGIKHPPTCDDTVSLGTGRKILGWLTLAFILIGFTPNPISESTVPIETVPATEVIQQNETSLNETSLNETSLNETSLNETSLNETSLNETSLNEAVPSETNWIGLVRKEVDRYEFSEIKQNGTGRQ